MFARTAASNGRMVALRCLLAALALVLTACASGTETFNPAEPCGVDGRSAGAYPDLEARLPGDLDGTTPGTRDSGRNCSEAALGSLISHDAEGIEFAGVTWDLGRGTGASSVIFRLPDRDLPAAWVAEFYEIGARTAKRTEHIEASRPVFDGAGQTWRLDTLNGLSLQTVVTWQDGSVVRVVLAASTVAPDASRAAHDDLVERAIDVTVAAMAARP